MVRDKRKKLEIIEFSKLLKCFEMSEIGKQKENVSNENEDCAMISIELAYYNSYNTVSVWKEQKKLQRVPAFYKHRRKLNELWRRWYGQVTCRSCRR